MARFIHSGTTKRRFVQQMFGDVVSRYDILNRLLSIGMDQKWRRRLLALMELPPGTRMLDLACGTGDIAQLAGETAKPGFVAGADPVLPMLNVAAIKYPPLKRICCEGEMLPFCDGAFNATTIAFGVRNFSCIESGLHEIHRTLSPGGILAILEFGLPTTGIFRGFYSWYLKHILPLAGCLSHQENAYRYLSESIAHFPPPHDFMQLLSQTGFQDLYREQYLGGTVHIYTGRKSG